MELKKTKMNSLLVCLVGNVKTGMFLPCWKTFVIATEHGPLIVRLNVKAANDEQIQGDNQ